MTPIPSRQTSVASRKSHPQRKKMESIDFSPEKKLTPKVHRGFTINKSFKNERPYSRAKSNERNFFHPWGMPHSSRPWDGRLERSIDCRKPPQIIAIFPLGRWPIFISPSRGTRLQSPHP